MRFSWRNKRLWNAIARLGPRLLANDVFKGSATALAIQFIVAILNFAMFALLSRQMGPDAFGSFAMIFSAMGFLAVTALCGQEVLISRSWGEYVSSNRPALARGVLTFGAQVTCVAAALISVAVVVAWWEWNQSIPLMFAACAFLITQTLVYLVCHFSRVAVSVLIGDGPAEIIWRSVVVIVILAHYWMGIAFSATEFFSVAATGLLLGIIVQIRKVSRFIPEAVKRAKPQYNFGLWVPRSFRMWLSTLSDIAAQYLEVVVIGLFLGPTVAGFYFVATRIASVFAIMSGGTGMYATSVIGLLFYSDAKAKLQDVLRSLALMNTTLMGGGLLAVIIAGKPVLWSFGSVYVSAYPSLIVLAVGAAVAALAGPARNILTLTGHEGVYPVIMGAGLALRLLLFATLGPAYGLLTSRWRGASRPSPSGWRSPSRAAGLSASTRLRERPWPNGPPPSSASEAASHDPRRRRSACNSRARSVPCRSARDRDRAKGRQDRSPADTG